jgi:hypothetical protein
MNAFTILSLLPTVITAVKTAEAIGVDIAANAALNGNIVKVSGADKLQAAMAFVQKEVEAAYPGTAFIAIEKQVVSLIGMLMNLYNLYNVFGNKAPVAVAA